VGCRAVTLRQDQGGEDVTTELPKVRIGRKLYYKDARLREFRAVDNPDDRMSFREIMQLYMDLLCQLRNAMNVLEVEP
jgi:hypothetical protein